MVFLRLHVKIFEKEFRKLSSEKLWEIIGELLIPYPNIFDKDAMSYDEVLELCVILKVNDDIFRNLKQVDILKRKLDELDNS